MKALFNGTCVKCHVFKPRCAHVYFRRAGKATAFVDRYVALCGDCRKLHRGRFRCDDKHK